MKMQSPTKKISRHLFSYLQGATSVGVVVLSSTLFSFSWRHYIVVAKCFTTPLVEEALKSIQYIVFVPNNLVPCLKPMGGRGDYFKENNTQVHLLLYFFMADGMSIIQIGGTDGRTDFSLRSRLLQVLLRSNKNRQILETWLMSDDMVSQCRGRKSYHLEASLHSPFY